MTRKPRKPAAGAGILACLALLAACGQVGGGESPPPATVTRVPGTTVERVTLTGRAAARLGIATAPVREAAVAGGGGHGKPRKIIPYAAVIYDTEGVAWAYVRVAPLAYQREPLAVAGIQGGIAVLDRGPAVGAQVVTVGAPELLGVEYHISGEQ